MSVAAVVKKWSQKKQYLLVNEKFSTRTVDYDIECDVSLTRRLTPLIVLYRK